MISSNYTALNNILCINDYPLYSIIKINYIVIYYWQNVNEAISLVEYWGRDAV
jgi:hypothetical protein